MICRVFTAALCAVSALAAAPARAAQLVDEQGYHYVHISLGGLWGGFFTFLIGIFTVLVGLFLYFAWRKADRQKTQTPLTADRPEEDEQVF